MKKIIIISLILIIATSCVNTQKQSKKFALKKTIDSLEFIDERIPEELQLLVYRQKGIPFALDTSFVWVPQESSWYFTTKEERRINFAIYRGDSLKIITEKFFTGRYNLNWPYLLGTFLAVLSAFTTILFEEDENGNLNVEKISFISGIVAGIFYLFLVSEFTLWSFIIFFLTWLCLYLVVPEKNLDLAKILYPVIFSTIIYNIVNISYILKGLISFPTFEFFIIPAIVIIIINLPYKKLFSRKEELEE